MAFTLIALPAPLSPSPYANGSLPVPTQAAPDIVIDGTIDADDRGTIRDLAFDVPADVTRVRAAFTLDGSDGTQVTPGVADSQRDRDWSGGIKKAFVIDDMVAIASSLPGPIAAGRWRLTMTVASIRPGGRATYRADIRFNRRDEPTVGAFPDAPVGGGAGWYSGDLRTHTGHSDARCRSLSGATIPCPLFLTAQAGADAGLGFPAVTDHNVTSQDGPTGSWT